MAIAQLAKRMSPKGWAMIGGSAAVAILFIYMLMQFASAPSYSTLMTGLDPAQTGKMTTTLSTAGIAYQLQNNGTALAVVSSQTAQARVALATAGLLGAQAQPGFSLFDKQSLGQSNFQQQITYQRALEGQLATTIESVNGVSSAQVQLVLPSTQSQLFADNSTPVTAAVELAGSNALDSSSVRGIAQLVSSSVPGLALDKVTVTDGSGQLLWPSSDTTASSGGLPAKQATQQRYDAAMATQVDALLATTLGAGKAQVTVNADLNADQANSDTLVYAKKGVPLTQQTQVETLTGTGGAGGAAGTASNIPTYTTTGTGSGKSNYKNQTGNTTFGVDKTITHAVIAPGKINQQSISVLVDKSVPASALPAIKAAVTNAVGLQAKRGDTLSIGQLAFVKQPVTPPAATPSSMGKYAKYGIVGFVSLLFLVFAGRLLRRREREAFAGQPTWLRELESPRSLAALERRQQAGLGPGDATDVLQLRAPVNVAKRQVEELVQRDPERVAQQVRAWMAEE